MDFSNVISVIGALTGVMGIIYSVRANHFSKQAVSKAEAANQIARNANSLSEKSNEIAIDSNKIAQNANDLVSRGIQIENERWDVRWEGDWYSPTVYRYVNVGDNEALNVTAEVTVNEFSGKSSVESVPSKGFIDIELPEIREEYERYRTDTAKESIWPTVAFQSPLNYPINEHISYETELGKPLVHDRYYAVGGLYDSENG